MDEFYPETYEQDWTNASICTDDANRVIGMNSNNITGNTGWMLMPENLTGKTEQEIFDRLTEEHGVPLYKVEGGAMVCRTEAEIAADIPDEPAPVLPVTWDALAAAYQEGVNQA